MILLVGQRWHPGVPQRKPSNGRSDVSAGTSNIPLQELVARVVDGSSLAVQGGFLHRGPFAFIRELIRQGRKNLELVTIARLRHRRSLPRGCLLARARIVAMEEFRPRAWYRPGRRDSQIRSKSTRTPPHGGSRAAFGVPFMPCGGIHGSDLAALNGWQAMATHGSGQTVLIPRIAPNSPSSTRTTSAKATRVYGTSH
jgi:glutaconate CoA-transferase subunit A